MPQRVHNYAPSPLRGGRRLSFAAQLKTLSVPTNPGQWPGVIHLSGDNFGGRQCHCPVNWHADTILYLFAQTGVCWGCNRIPVWSRTYDRFSSYFMITYDNCIETEHVPLLWPSSAGVQLDCGEKAPVCQYKLFYYLNTPEI